MNGFTKEELQSIQSSFIALGCIDQNLDFKLADKIQSLIDNYCEHEFVIPQFSTVEECSKCKQYVTHKVIE